MQTRMASSTVMQVRKRMVVQIGISLIAAAIMAAAALDVAAAQLFQGKDATCTNGYSYPVDGSQTSTRGLKEALNVASDRKPG